MDSSSSNAPQPVGLYPSARRVGNLLFVSGVGPRLPKSAPAASSVPGLELDAAGNYRAFDFEAQVRGVFRNIEAALQSGGLTRYHILDVQVFLTDLHQQFSTLNKVWDEYFKDVPQLPTRTTIGVSQLPGFNLVEMKVIASSS